ARAPGRSSGLLLCPPHKTLNAFASIQLEHLVDGFEVLKCLCRKSVLRLVGAEKTGCRWEQFFGGELCQTQQICDLGIGGIQALGLLQGGQAISQQRSAPLSLRELESLFQERPAFGEMGSCFQFSLEILPALCRNRAERRKSIEIFDSILSVRNRCFLALLPRFDVGRGHEKWRIFRQEGQRLPSII